MTYLILMTLLLLPAYTLARDSVLRAYYQSKRDVYWQTWKENMELKKDLHQTKMELAQRKEWCR